MPLMKGWVKASTPQRPPVETTAASAAAMLCRPLPVNTSCSGAGDHAPCDRYAAAILRTVQAFCDERRLIGKRRIIELEIDPDAARLTWRRNAAPGIARDEGAPAHFADDKAAAQQLGVDAARRRDGDLARVGKIALGRQAVARFERAVGDFRRDGVGQLQVFGLRHIAPRAMIIA